MYFDMVHWLGSLYQTSNGYILNGMSYVVVLRDFICWR